MSANTDTQMTRFLFAILKQKNLKDIDWNAVAKDPVLSQEITNGHAARMRYSRFRSAMLGLEPKPRNTSSKNKVTKSKKDTKSSVKTTAKDSYFHSNANDAKKPDSTIKDHHSPPTKVKQEVLSHQQQSIFNNFHFTPTSMASVPTSQADQAHPSPMRLLTPCSDDMLPASASGAFQFGSPVASVFSALDFSSAAVGPCGHEEDAPHDHVGEHHSWAGSPAFSAFEAAYNNSLNSYGLGDFCEHHQESHQADMQAGSENDNVNGMRHASPVMANPMAERAQIKDEPWDGNFRI